MTNSMIRDDRSARAPRGPRYTCDDDCGRVHATLAAATRHAERRGAVPVELPDERPRGAAAGEDGPRPAGRPPLEPDARRTVRLDLRLTAAESEELARRAVAAGLTVSGYVRLRCLGPAECGLIVHEGPCCLAARHVGPCVAPDGAR